MNSCVIQGCPARVDLVLQARNGRPEQRHGASDMRSCHGGAVGKRIGIIGAITGGTRASARSGDIRFYPAASIDSSRTAATKGSNGIGAGVQCPDRVRCRIERWWICHSGTTRSGVTRCDHHHNASSGLSFNGRLQCVNRTAFRCRTTPGVDGNVRRFGRVALIRVAAYRVRRQEELHALDVPGRRADTLVHVAASNPLCAGRHPNLVRATVGADRCASRVAAMEEVIARLWRVGTADTTAGMNGVMPVVIVIARYPIPAAVVRFKRVMRPANTGIGTRHDNILAGKTKRPDARRMRVIDSRFDRLRSPGLRRLHQPQGPVGVANFESADCPRRVPRRAEPPTSRRSRGRPSLKLR